jgi:uncharacterized protein DUF4260
MSAALPSVGEKQGVAVAIVSEAAGGVVVGAPRAWLRLEGAALLAGSMIAYSSTNQAWWLVPLALLLPDLSMAGYLGGKRLGAHLYNVAHTTPIPAALIGIGWWQDKSFAVALGLIWLAHIGLDRLIGYGLKYDDDFKHTHLGLMNATRA